MTQFQRANSHCDTLLKQINLAKRINGFTSNHHKMATALCNSKMAKYLLSSREGIDTYMEKLVESSVIASWSSRVTSVHSLISINSSH